MSVLLLTYFSYFYSTSIPISTNIFPVHQKNQDLIAKQRINLAEVSYLDLDFVAKIIKNLGNPKTNTVF